MSKDYTCECGYLWTSRKSIGGPGRCPKCGSTEIQPYSPLSRTYTPSNSKYVIHEGSSHWRYKKPEYTDPDQLKKMEDLRAKIKARIQSQE
jgi:hypothetical protein